VKAGVYTGPGVIEAREWPEPIAKPGEVKVKVAYAGICGTDVELLHDRFGLGPRASGPRVFGHEAAGSIVELGPGLKGEWKVGQRVALGFRAACGVCYYCRTKREHFCEHDSRASGAFAEYGTFPEGALYSLPDDVGFELAALVEPLSIAVRAVDCAGIKNGQTLAISGAGTIGLLALAVALDAGACDVLVMEPRVAKREMALSMGARIVVDPFSEDVRAAAAELTGGRGFDAFIESSGDLRLAEAALESVDKGGTIVWVGVAYPADAEAQVSPFQLYLKEVTVRSPRMAPYSFERTLRLLSKLDIGSVVTNTYALDEIAEAFRNHERGESVKTLIRM